MTNAAQQIIASLNEVFAPMDARVLTETKEWAAGRTAAIREFKASDEGKALARNDQWSYYSKLHNMAGGKTWYNVFNGRSAQMIEEFVIKNCAAIAEKRNAMIANKLAKAGVTEVAETTFNRTNDGFNGVFRVMTNNGQKTVTVNTIYAGGYNIQCLHLRVLVKVR